MVHVIDIFRVSIEQVQVYTLRGKKKVLNFVDGRRSFVSVTLNDTSTRSECESIQSRKKSSRTTYRNHDGLFGTKIPSISFACKGHGDADKSGSSIHSAGLPTYPTGWSFREQKPKLAWLSERLTNVGKP